ncbi:unnamed protein product [Prunus armeniaca]
MSGPTGGRNSIAHTPALPTTRVAHILKYQVLRTQTTPSHTGTANDMCDDSKQYTYSSHTPALPTTRMGSVLHAGTANGACKTHNHMFFPHAGTANDMCGKPSNQGMVLT